MSHSLIYNESVNEAVEFSLRTKQNFNMTFVNCTFFGEFLDHCVLLCKGELQSDCEVIYFNPSHFGHYSNFVSCSAATYNFFSNPSLLKVFEYKTAKTCECFWVCWTNRLSGYWIWIWKKNCKTRTHCKKRK